MVKYCPRCGVKLNKEDRFCFKCGYKFKLNKRNDINKNSKEDYIKNNTEINSVKIENNNNLNDTINNENNVSSNHLTEEYISNIKSSALIILGIIFAIYYIIWILSSINYVYLSPIKNQYWIQIIIFTSIVVLGLISLVYIKKRSDSAKITLIIGGSLAFLDIIPSIFGYVNLNNFHSSISIVNTATNLMSVYTLGCVFGVILIGIFYFTAVCIYKN